MLRHLLMAELIALRDNEAPVAARTHIDECEACAAELERLYQRVAALKALPGFSPPRDRWQLVRGQVAASRRRARRWMGMSGLAAAAVLALAVGVSRVQPGEAAVTPHTQVQALMKESSRLEGMLRTVGEDGRVVNGITAAAIADLEDRIALIDVGLQMAQERRYPVTDMRDLWDERVTLMGALVNTHVRQVSYVGF